MKTKCLAMVVLIFFSGCAREQPSHMTPQEQEAAKEEIGQAVQRIIESLERKDTEALFESYSDSSDFLLFTTDGSMMDYQEAERHHTEWFKSLSSLNVTTLKEEVRFLPGSAAICSWLGTFETTLETGQEPKADFAITFVFRRVENRWKVVYQQTAALPPVRQGSEG